MKGKSLIAENLELVFRTWRACGQSPTLTIKTLKEQHDFSVTRTTLDQWIEKNGWRDRAARAEAEERRGTDPQLTGTERMIAALVSQQQKYEAVFESFGPLKVDPQLTYAYQGLVKTIVDIQDKSAARKAELFIEFMRELIGWMQKHDPESAAGIEKNFDDFIMYAKEKYRK